MNNGELEAGAKNELLEKKSKTSKEKQLLIRIVQEDIFNFVKNKIIESIGELSMGNSMKNNIEGIERKMNSNSFKEACLSNMGDIYNPINREYFTNLFEEQGTKVINR